MKLIRLFTALLICGNALAQTPAELDQKGGFKTFKLGDGFATHSDKIKFTKTLENADTKLYLVRDLVSVKTYTGEIELTFYKDKIKEITVSFKNSSEEGYKDLFESLEVLYGPGQVFKEKSPKFERFEKMFVWNGEKIALRLSYDANRKLSEMVFYEQKNQLQKLKEEF